MLRTDQPTDRPTEKWLYESRSTRLKREDKEEKEKEEKEKEEEEEEEEEEEGVLLHLLLLPQQLSPTKGVI